MYAHITCSEELVKKNLTIQFVVNRTGGLLKDLFGIVAINFFFFLFLLLFSESSRNETKENIVNTFCFQIVFIFLCIRILLKPQKHFVIVSWNKGCVRKFFHELL